MYEDALVLERSIRLELEAGLNRVHIHDLEGHLGLESVRAHLEGALVLSIDCRHPGPAVVEDAKDDETELLSRRVGAETLLALIVSLAPAEQPSTFDPDGYAQSTDYLLALTTELAEELRTLRREASAQRTAQSTSGPRTRVELLARAPRSGSYRLTLRCEPGWATWRPSYIVRVHDLASSGPAAEARAWGQIYHRQGLSGRAKTVELSGARRTSGSIPRPRGPWVIRSDGPYDERSNQLHRGEAVARDEAPRSEEGQNGAPSAPEAPPGRFPYGPSRKAQGPVELGPSPVPVPLGPLEVETTQAFLLRPAADRRSFAQLTVRPRGDETLPAGRAEIFVADVFRGELDLGLASAESPWQIDLGPEARIAAHRFVSTALQSEGLLSRGDIHRAKVRIDVESSLDSACFVRVEEQLPTSADPRLKVRLLSAFLEPTSRGRTDAAEPEVSGSLVAFTVRLETNVRRTCVVEYVIEAPKDYRIVQTLEGDG